MIVSSLVTAAIVGGAISGGSQVANSVIQSRANSKATKAQTDAADKALAFEREQFEAEQARLAPYRDLGTQSYGKLAQMLGLPPGQTPAPQAPGWSSDPARGSAVPRGPMAPPTGPVTAKPEMGGTSGILGGAASAADPNADMRPSAPVGNTFTLARRQGRGTVRVKHPRTGEVREVPEWQAPALVQRGGQVIQ